MRGRSVQRREGGNAPVHDDDFPHPEPDPGLDQERDVEDAHALAAQPALRDLPRHRAAHGGVHDGVERAPARLVGEHERAELRAVEVPVGLQDLAPERGDDLGVRARARAHDLARDDVRVDDGDGARGEQRGDGGLAGRDSSRETYDCARCGQRERERRAWQEGAVPSMVVSVVCGRCEPA